MNKIVFGYWNYSGQKYVTGDIPIAHVKYRNRPLCNPSFNNKKLKFVVEDVCMEACKDCLKLYLEGDIPDIISTKEFPKLRLGI